MCDCSASPRFVRELDRLYDSRTEICVLAFRTIDDESIEREEMVFLSAIDCLGLRQRKLESSLWIMFYAYVYKSMTNSTDFADGGLSFERQGGTFG